MSQRAASVAASSRDAESDVAAAVVIGSSDAPVGAARRYASFDAVAGGSTIAGPSAASMGLASETATRFSPAVAAGLAAFMGDDSISRVDASFALETEWTSAQWIDGAFADQAVVSPGGAIEDTAEANDAEAQERRRAAGCRCRDDHLAIGRHPGESSGRATPAGRLQWRRRVITRFSGRQIPLANAELPFALVDLDT